MSILLQNTGQLVWGSERIAYPKLFATVWRERFPDPAQGPALAFVPSTGIMFDGPLIEIDPTCVAK
jgi:hypothetical protein